MRGRSSHGKSYSTRYGGYDHYPSTRTVDNHIASLRAKVEEDASNPYYLLTVHGVGYKFTGAR